MDISDHPYCIVTSTVSKPYCTLLRLKIALLLLWVTNISALQAQRGWEVGAAIGTALYVGDINPTWTIQQPGFSAGGILRYNWDTRLVTRLQGGYALIHGSDAIAQNTYRKLRNLRFLTHIVDLSAALELNFLPFIHGSYGERFAPFFFVGGALLYFKPTAPYRGRYIALRPLGTEGQANGSEYPPIAGAALFGGGVKFNLSRSWSLVFEVQGFRTFTDYLDDVSGTYPDKALLRSQRGHIAVELSDPSLPHDEYPNIGAAGYQRGDNIRYDSYFTITVGSLYYFGRIDCPKIIYP